MNTQEPINEREFSPEEIDAMLDDMRASERGTAYRVLRTKATIHLDRFWLQMQGQEEPYAKLDKLEGQVVASLILRNLYRSGYNYPLCSSLDGGVTGTIHPEVNFDIGIPDGQSCASCPWNKFRTAGVWEPVGDNGKDNSQSKGKACKERRALAMILPGETEPIVVSLPTKSMLGWDAYANGFDKLRSSYLKQMTQIGIETVTENNNTYGVATFRSLGEVPMQQVAHALLNKSAMYVPLLSAQVFVEKDAPMEKFSVPADGAGAPPPPDSDWDSSQPLDEQPF